ASPAAAGREESVHTSSCSISRAGGVSERKTVQYIKCRVSLRICAPVGGPAELAVSVSRHASTVCADCRYKDCLCRGVPVSEEILINVTPRETRVGVVENGMLQEVHVERASRRGYVGNVYKGRVQRVMPGMQAVFVDIGLERAAFLHASDILRPPVP